MGKDTNKMNMTSLQITDAERAELKKRGLTLRAALLKALEMSPSGDPLRQELREWRISKFTSMLAESRPTDKSLWHDQLCYISIRQFRLGNRPKTTQSYFTLLEKYAILLRMTMTELDKLAQGETKNGINMKKGGEGK